jgi:hypothetical protein
MWIPFIPAFLIEVSEKGYYFNISCTERYFEKGMMRWRACIGE